jgi:hypothetical protein
VHDPKGLVIVAVFAACACGNPALAQQDAAQKAREGGIDHWIEYYKGQQSRPVPPRQGTKQSATPPTGPAGAHDPNEKSAEPADPKAAPK